VDIETLAYALLWMLVIIEGVGLIILARTLGSILLGGREAIERDGLSIGAPAPSFEAVALDGSVVRSDSYRGRWLALVFAAPTCRICHAMLPDLAVLAEKVTGEADVLLLVRSTAEVAREMHVHAPVEVLAIGEHGVADQYRVRVSPYVQIVDPRGVIRARGLVNVASHVEHLLRQAGLGQTIALAQAAPLASIEVHS
jgi:methylamine dehydrogenase accessory protein MauD